MVVVTKNELVPANLTYQMWRVEQASPAVKTIVLMMQVASNVDQETSADKDDQATSAYYM